MAETGMCPCCGFNLIPDLPIDAGRWRLLPHESYFDGQRLKLTPGEAIFLHTVAKAEGKPLTQSLIGLRTGDGEHPGGVARVHACHLRQKLPEVPFETVRGRGYRWAA